MISQSSKIEILSKACVIIMNFSALEITLKIEQKSTFLDKKYKIVISYVPCEIFLDIKCLKYYLAEIKSKKNDFYFLAIIQNWFLSKCNFSLRKSNAIYWQLYKFAWQFESDEIWKCKSIKVKLKSERRKTRSMNENVVLASPFARFLAIKLIPPRAAHRALVIILWNQHRIFLNFLFVAPSVTKVALFHKGNANCRKFPHMSF